MISEQIEQILYKMRARKKRQNTIHKQNRQNPTARGWKNRGNTTRTMRARKYIVDPMRAGGFLKYI